MSLPLNALLLHSPFGFASLFLLFSSVQMTAQPVCRTVSDQVDEFTRSHVLTITASDHSNGPRFEWMAIDGSVCLRLHWRTAQERPAVVFEGDSLFVKLENDSVLILRSMETTVGAPMLSDEGQPYTDAVYCYRIEPGDLGAIADLWVVKMRIHFRESRNEFVASADPDWQMGFWRSANCVRQAIHTDPMPVVRTIQGGRPASTVLPTHQ